MAFDGFDEQCGSPKYDFGIDSQSATRMGLIDGSNIQSLLDELFPLFGQSPISLPGFPYIKARRCRIVPFADENQPTNASSSDLLLSTLNTYDKWMAEIEYSYNPQNAEEDSSQDPNNPDPVSLLNHRWSIGGEFLSISPKSFQWEADSEPIEQDLDIGKLIPTIEHQITWPRVQYPPFSAIRNTIGRVNLNHTPKLNFQTGAIDSETLLFLGADLQREILSSGTLGWEVTYRFSERVVDVDASSGDSGVVSNSAVGGWNHFYRSDDQFRTTTKKAGFYRIESRDTWLVPGDPVFQLVDFLPLFQQETPP